MEEDSSISTPSLVNEEAEIQTDEDEEQSAGYRYEGPTDSSSEELAEDEDLYDDEVSSEESYQEGGELRTSSSRVIAVGLPSALVAESGIPMTRTLSIASSAASDHEEEEDYRQEEVTRRPHQSESDAHQEAISEVVAESLAEREHNEKMGIQKPPPESLATITPRTSTLGTDDKHQLMEQGGLDAPDLQRRGTSGSVTKASAQTTSTDEEEIEAEVGIPVGMPGAFAVGGIGTDVTAGWESDFEEDEEQMSQEDSSEELNLPPQDVPSNQGPIIGVLSNRGQLRAEGQEGDEAIVLDVLPEPQATSGLRGRLLKIGLVVVLVVIVVVVVVVVVSRDSSSSTDPPDDNDWIIVGDSIVGSIDDNVEFGNVVSLASNGNRVAVGAPGWNEGASQRNVGQSQIVDWTGTEWVAVFQVDGPGPEARAGSSISLSKDNSKVAIGAPFWQNGRGHVIVYEETSDNWSVVGSELLGNETTDGRFGSSVALSPSGDILIVGAPTSDGPDAENKGMVRAFTSTDASTWSQLGSAIEGDAALSQFGWSVASCANGQRLVSGAPGSDSISGGTGDFTGQVKILGLEGTEWVQVGQSIYGTAAEDRFGHSVACSDDGSIVAVGANQNTNPGYVRVFQYNDDDTWVQMGEDIIGDNNFDGFGFSISLSFNGKGLAVGSPLNDGVDRDAGKVKIFDYIDETESWSLVEREITGTAIGDRFGWSVSLSDAGDRVACGAPFADFDGRLINVGNVEVYERQSSVD